MLDSIYNMISKLLRNYIFGVKTLIFSRPGAKYFADLGPNTLKSIQIHYNYFD